MIRFMFLFALVVLLPHTALAGGSFTACAVTDSMGQVRPRVLIGADLPVGETMGVQVDALVNGGGYANALVGPRLILGGLYTSLGVGLDNTENYWRVQATVAYTQKWLSGLLIYQDGGAGPWHLLKVSGGLNAWRVGVMSHYGDGEGPFAQMKVSPSLTLGIAPLYKARLRVFRPEGFNPENPVAVQAWGTLSF